MAYARRAPLFCARQFVLGPIEEIFHEFKHAAGMLGQIAPFTLQLIDPHSLPGDPPFLLVKRLLQRLDGTPDLLYKISH